MAYRIKGDVVVARDLAASGSVLAGNGSAAAPTFAWADDNDTGIYKPATNQIGFSTSGSQRGYFDNVGALWLDDGVTDAQVSISPSGVFYSGQSSDFGITGANETTTGLSARAFRIRTGDGGPASGAGTAGGDAGYLDFLGGTGGDASGSDAAGEGGHFIIFGGNGGSGTATVPGGVGGNFYFRPGSGGSDGGAGAGSDGFFSINGLSTSEVRLQASVASQSLEIGCAYGIGDPGPAVSTLVLYTGIAPIPLEDGHIFMLSDRNVVIGNSNPGRSVQFWPDTGSLETGRFDGTGLKVNDGGELLPSISFLSDPNTGMYWVTASVTAVVASGSEVVRFANAASNPQALFNSGSVSLPSISFKGDENTGIHTSAADVLVISTGGSSRMIFSAGACRVVNNLNLPNGNAAGPSARFNSDITTGLFRPLDGWNSTGVGIAVTGDEVVRFENDNAWDDGNVQITKNFILPTAVEQVWQVDITGPTFVDLTTSASNATVNDWAIFPNVEAVGDYMAIGMDRPFVSAIFNNTGGVAGSVGAVTWEYWNGSTWAALTGLTDGTIGFTAAVSAGQILKFKEPADWATTALNGVTKYYIRARVTTVYTSNPIYDQVKIASRQAGSVVNLSGASDIITGEYAQMDAYKVIIPEISGGTIDFRFFAVEFLNSTVASIQSNPAGGIGMYLTDSSTLPGYSFIDSNGDPDTTMGMGGDTGANTLYFHSNGESVAVDAGGATPSFRPNTDDTWTLGESALRWNNVYAVTSTIGDLVMKNPSGGKQHWKLIEGHETIWLFNIQTGKKYRMGMQPAKMNSEDEKMIKNERNKYPELYGER